MQQLLSKFTAFVVVVLLLVACSKNNPCLINDAVTARMAFKTIDDSLREKDTILLNPSISLLNTSYIGFKTNTINFPIASNVAAMDYVFVADTSNPIFDTIHLSYTKSLNYISKECGFNFFYKIDSVYFNKVQIKNIIITDSVINNNAQKVNFKVIL